jgi:glycyl-tRNA synthetase (class II)
MKTGIFAIGVSAIMTAVLFTGCYDHWHKIEGNYDVVTETRSLHEFDRVINEGEFDVYIIQDGLSEVEIEAESNLISHIRTDVDGDVLKIDTKDNLQPNYTIKVYVHTTNIQEVKLSGSGLIHVADVTTGDLELGISGSGEMELWGVADRGDFDISGSGTIHAYELQLQECYANISGSGDMQVTVQDYLNVRISGSGSVYYMGNPIIESNISGSGDIIHP